MVFSLEKNRKDTISGILLLVVGILILLSLISRPLERNYIGVAGWYLARGLFRAFGKGAFLIPLMFYLWAIGSFLHKSRESFWRAVSGWTAGLVILCVFLKVIKPPAGWGGWLGGFLGHGLMNIFGKTGSYIIIFACLLIALIVAVEWSPIKAIQNWRGKKKKNSARQKEAKVIARRKPKPIQPELPITKAEGAPSWEPPSRELLTPPEKKQTPPEILKEQAGNLETALSNFGIKSRVTRIHHGPVITRYELEIAPGVKVSRITQLANDISMNLKAKSIRILAPIPGKGAIGIEVPNRESALVYLREVLETSEFQEADSLSIALGEGVNGEMIVANLSQMPHLLIAGATGSGKTVCINTIIISILFKSPPNEVKFLLIDPKMVELTVYNEIPHLLAPVVTNARAAVKAFRWVISEMEKRYKQFAEIGVRDIEGYNKSILTSPTAGQTRPKLPYIIVIVDELADIMAVAFNEVENAIIRLAQLSRAVGIHLILATQRPSVNVITGIIKANLPARIAFQVVSKVDSRTILDMNGAETLIGRGDLLYLPTGAPKPIRLQGAWISRPEIERVINFIKSQKAAGQYPEEIFKVSPEELTKEPPQEIPLFKEAVELVLTTGQASTSFLQRRLHIGYNNAANLIEEMERRGIIGPQQAATQRREILVDKSYLDKL